MDPREFKLAKVKDHKTLQIPGCHLVVETRDGSVYSVSIMDAATGRLLLFVSKAEYSGMELYVPAPPEKVTVWKLSGTVAKLPVDERFPDEFAGIRRKDELEETGCAQGLELSKVEEEVP